MSTGERTRPRWCCDKGEEVPGQKGAAQNGVLARGGGHGYDGEEGGNQSPEDRGGGGSFYTFQSVGTGASKYTVLRGPPCEVEN